MLLSIYLILSSLLFTVPDCENLEHIRENYGNIQTEEELKSFIKLVESVNCKEAVPYLASATMQKAQFALAPWTKYRYFLSGKKMLEDHIKSNPGDIDARYIRFLVQTHAPFFLGYNNKIDTDESFIRQNIEEYQMSRTYKEQIYKHLEQFNKN
jgi:hypothetical protein